jgi:hypothetical protein
MIIAKCAGCGSVFTKRMSIPDFMRRIVADGSVRSVIRTLRTYLDGNWKIRRHTMKFLTMIQQLISSYDASEIRAHDKATLCGTYLDTWLKFGSYTLPEDIYRRWDLFVDTQTNFVYAAENGSADCCIAEKWDSIDACLCCLFERLREQTLGAENT